MHIDFDFFGDDPVSFDSALPRFAAVIFSDRELSGRFLRDAYGHLIFITTDPSVYRSKLKLFNDKMDEEGKKNFLFPFVKNAEDSILSVSKDDEFLFEFARTENIQISKDRFIDIEVIDRRVVGDEWLSDLSGSVDVTGARRIVFFSMKGGVGRSTAIAILTAHLAAKGLNVLAIDLDLEAPGLGSILLDMENVPEYGVVDWLAQISAGGDPSHILREMVAVSPFTRGRAAVDVVPAFGAASLRVPDVYLAKLARAYSPGAAEGPYVGKNFAEKCSSLIKELEHCRQYDVVLIDSRAGMHETSASALMSLGGAVIFFGIDTTQTIDDYRLLFAALKGPLKRLASSDPAAADRFRDRLQVVNAKADDPSDEGLRQLREGFYDIFSEFVYDEEVDGVGGSEAFRFALDDQDAPHWAWSISAHSAMTHFDPRKSLASLEPSVYERAFGTFLNNVCEKLLGDVQTSD